MRGGHGDGRDLRRHGSGDDDGQQARDGTMG
jgi:hypothetical protein